MTGTLLAKELDRKRALDMNPIKNGNGLNYLNPADILSATLTSVPPSGYTRSGYGSKLPTRYMVTLTDKRPRRVYCMLYSNSGTRYVLTRSHGKLFVGPEALDKIQALVNGQEH